MPKKPRIDPFSEGSVAYMWKHFFGPMLQYKPHDMDMKAFLEDVVFDIKHREIIRYKARESFVMPGLLYVAPMVRIQGLGYRDVAAGTELFVRFDARNPESVDIEFQGGQGGADQWLNLSRSEWYRVAPLLDVVIEKADRVKVPRVKKEPPVKKRKRRRKS